MRKHIAGWMIFGLTLASGCSPMPRQSASASRAGKAGAEAADGSTVAVAHAPADPRLAWWSCSTCRSPYQPAGPAGPPLLSSHSTCPPHDRAASARPPSPAP